jgi:hypothetical protein
MWRIAKAFGMSWDGVMDLYERVLPNAPLDCDPRDFIKTTVKKPLFLPESPGEMDIDDEALESAEEASDVDELEEGRGAATGEVASGPGGPQTRRKRVFRHVGSFEGEEAEGEAAGASGSPRKRAKARPTIKIPPSASRQVVEQEARAQGYEAGATAYMQRQVEWSIEAMNRALGQERASKRDLEMMGEELRRTKALLAAERETLGEEREARAALATQVGEHGREVGRIRAEQARLEVMAREESRRRIEAEKERDVARKNAEEALRRIGQPQEPVGVSGQSRGVLALIGAEMASLEVARGQWESGVAGSSELVRASSHKIIKLVKEELDRL